MIWRGTVLLLFGQLLALLSGYGINIFLARHLGPADFGTFGVIYSILMIIELVVVAGIPNALQRFVGENPKLGYSLHKRLVWRQLIYALILLGVTFLLTPIIGRLLKDPKISFYLRIAIFDIVVFALYWYYNGFLIGQCRFGHVTLVATIYSVSKFVFIIVLVSVSFSVAGALVGNILGSFTGMLVGIFFFKVNKEKYVIPNKRLNRFIFSNIIYHIGLNLFFYIDFWFVKYYLLENIVGYYNAAAILSRIPFFFSVAISGAILPYLSHAIAQKNRQDIENLIKQAIRVMLIFLLLTCILIINNAPQLISLLMGEQYLGAAKILQILFIGMCGISLMYLMNTITIAKSGMKGCSIVVIFLVLLDFCLNLILVPKFQSQGAALSTSLTMLVGVIISSVYVINQFDVFLGIRSLIRIILMAVVILLISILYRTFNWPELLLKFILLGLLYILLLKLSGEITTSDLYKLKLIFSSKSIKNKTIS